MRGFVAFLVIIGVLALVALAAIGRFLYHVVLSVKRAREEALDNARDAGSFDESEYGDYHKKRKAQQERMRQQRQQNEGSRTSGNAGQSSGGQQRWSQQTTSGSGGTTIIDTRDPDVSQRRIFADDEGEYVQFEEVAN